MDTFFTIEDLDLLTSDHFIYQYSVNNSDYLRADVCKYQPEVCNSEKLKISQKNSQHSPR